MRNLEPYDPELVVGKTFLLMIVTLLLVMLLGGCASAMADLPALPFLAAPVPPVDVPELDKPLVEPPAEQLAERVCPQVPKSWWETVPRLPSFDA